MKRWNTTQLDEIYTAIRRQLDVLIHSGDDFGKAVPVNDWTGPAADTAGSAHRALMSRIDKLAAGASIVGKAITQAADAITGVQNAITNAEELALKYGYQITDSGTVTDTFRDREPPPDLHPQDRERACRQVVDDVTQALRTAEDIDSDLASVLERAETGEFGTGDETTVAAAAAAGALDPGLTLPEPPAGATPSQTAAWWASLSPAGRAILLHDRPAALGAMDGLPAEVRDKANRDVFGQRYSDLRSQRDDLRQRMAALDRSDPTQQSEYFDLERELAPVDKKLQGLDAINERLTQPLPGQPPAFLLGVDTNGAGHAIIAVGNPDHAQNLATYVPGTYAGLDGFATDIQRADIMSQTASMINPVPTSVITWAGYDAPQSIVPDAAGTSFADHAEPGLRRFQDGLDASHDPISVNSTVIGHSYGTTVVGQTARDFGLPADNLVMVASPGVGVQHATDLRLDGVPPDQMSHHLYATKSAMDPVPALTNFDNPALDRIDPLGPDPTTGWFGGHPFDSDLTGGHSDYWDPNSKSLRGMAAVIAGAAAP
ncbi:alpha/beta hydrolase [Amycolatopsis sp. WQ 127309]|uniref:alpha/beta hydrolase n=1 Tax=Amycolatopsis sp. WQ 127309 TaxID=2932773 RepID=UPI001FF49D73|nr:alpha/beta hydrolase [Amycolatopsis sp. WQ 127309]UOZ04063.1 alpha/beta hydrolase family protein [Amycolatopsis sp. WQ 127309]